MIRLPILVHQPHDPFVGTVSPSLKYKTIRYICAQVALLVLCVNGHLINARALGTVLACPIKADRGRGGGGFTPPESPRTGAMRGPPGECTGGGY